LPVIKVFGFPASVNLKFPPVLSASSNVAPSPEKQRCVGEEGHKHRSPNPDVLTGILFCFVVIANPTPKLWKAQ
jgi:hypothetical protein